MGVLRPRILTGQVIYGDNKLPASYATVRVSSGPTARSAASNAPATSTVVSTDEKGRFQVSAQLYDSIAISARVGNYEARATTTTAEQEILGLRIQLNAPRRPSDQEPVPKHIEELRGEAPRGSAI
jgi:hypothetical protein